MDPSPFSPWRRSGRSRLAGLSTCAVIVALGIVVPSGWSRGITASGAADGAAPPEYRDSDHVPWGCYISTFVYLSRFLADHPHEQGRPMTVNLPSFGGPHTIAVVSWRGRWWGRDEYSGAFDLRCPVTASLPDGHLEANAENFLRKLSAWHSRIGKITTAGRAPAEITESARREAVSTAARLLPGLSQVFWVQRGRSEVPFLFFQPTTGEIAVYDPANGTATAECTPTDIPGVVATVAARLGYTVAAIRPHVPSPSSERAASAQTRMP